MTHYENICNNAHRISKTLSDLLLVEGDDRFPLRAVKDIADEFTLTGCISARQFQWMQSLHEQYCCRVEMELPDSFMATVMMLQFSSSKILTPKMLFTINDAGDRFALIWNTDKAQAYVTNGYARSNPASYIYGKLSARGKLLLRSTVTGRHEWPDVLAFLKQLAIDPIQAAKTSAARTGRCVYCWAELTDPISKQHGYGKTCAANWNLPYADHITDDTLRALFNKAEKVHTHA